MKRPLALATLAFLLHSLGSASAQSGVSHLSNREQIERIRLLPDEDRRWFDFVEPIILPDERNFFLLLTEPHEREIFREEFWKRREREGLASPLGPGYRRRYEDLRRMADETYDGWRQDAGRMVIAHGEPADLEVIEGCDNLFRHLEIWTYSGLEPKNRGPQRYFFYSVAPPSPRKLWSVGDPDSEIFQPGSCRKNFDQLYADCSDVRGDPCALSDCRRSVCHVYRTYQEIRTRQTSALAGRSESAQMLAPPVIPTEELSALAARFPGFADSRAKPLRVEAGSVAPESNPEARVWLSSEQIRDKLLALEPRYRQWLDLAAPLMTSTDLVSFIQLSAGEKEKFIREFFKRRS